MADWGWWRYLRDVELRAPKDLVGRRRAINIYCFLSLNRVVKHHPVQYYYIYIYDTQTHLTESCIYQRAAEDAVYGFARITFAERAGDHKIGNGSFVYVG